MLSKPGHNAIFLNKARIEEALTDRVVEYISEMADKKKIASLVCVELKASPPRLGTVTKHTFASKTHQRSIGLQ